MHMKEKSNFAVTSEGIEILTKKGIVEILTSYIEKINISTYSSPFKNRYGLYYNLFNYRKSKKTGKTSFYFYEIMYDKGSENDIAFFREKFCDFL